MGSFFNIIKMFPPTSPLYGTVIEIIFQR